MLLFRQRRAKYFFANFFDGIFFLVAFGLLMLSLAGYFGELGNYWELTAHFKVQYLLVSLIPCFFFLLRRHRVGIILSLICLLVNLVEVAPWYLPRWSTSPAAGQPLRVLQINVDKYAAQYPKVLALVQAEQPDVAVFLEVGKAGAKALEVLKPTMPYAIAHQDVEIDGAAIYSKLPFKAVAKPIGPGRWSIVVDLEILGQAVSLIASHPSNAVGKIYFDERNAQLAAIAEYAANIDHSLILVGDYNTTMWSPYYRKLVVSTKLLNARRGFGVLPTWKIMHSFFAIPIDHCFVSSNIRILNVHTGKSVGSDHLPLITDLLIPQT